MQLELVERIRIQYKIVIEGEDLPNPIGSFKNMLFPKPILKALKRKNIIKPTAIQMQGLPPAYFAFLFLMVFGRLAGRDLVGTAFTSSGKSLVFILPLLMLALAEEIKFPLISGEGPFGLILVPSVGIVCFFFNFFVF